MTKFEPRPPTYIMQCPVIIVLTPPVWPLLNTKFNYEIRDKIHKLSLKKIVVNLTLTNIFSPSE
jgi:hypothetical protein